MTDSPMVNRSRGCPMDSPSVVRTRSGSTTVRPQPVTEQSLMESVAGFINEVQAFNQPGTDPKSQVTWARFEQADINDPSLYTENHETNGSSLPLLLVLGYTQGVQVWLIPGSGEAKLVLSRFHGQVKALRILPTPETGHLATDHYSHARPLVALCDSSGPGTAFMSVSFVSLLSGDQVNNIKFHSEVADVCVNKRVICVAFRERVAIFDARTLREKMTITSCYPSPGVHTNPLALHDRWLAYSDRALCMARRSAGGMEGEMGQSVTAWGINVGSKLASGVTKICSNIFSGSPRSNPNSIMSQGGQSIDGETGVVTILDTVELCNRDEERGNENIDISNSKVEGVVAHFIAHTKGIVALQWDHSGSLLLTADKPGNSFHLFRIVAHPLGSAFAAVHHLYTLYRGDTPGSVQDIAFSPDSRWVTVSTLRGTTHIFPICPYGGPVGVRTHTSHRVVNKLSRFHRSAGLNENPPTTSSGRNSPNPTMGSSPASGKVFEFPPGIFLGTPIAYPSPHLPPYPSPTLIQPIAQLRQPYIVTLTSQVNLTGGRKPAHGKRNSVPDDIPIRLAVTFAPSRARVLQGVHAGYPRNNRKATDSLFVMANHGQLLEYSLDPVPDPTIPKDKVCESSPIELNIVAYGQWNLGKPTGKDRSEVTPPLDGSNPLLISKELLGSQESPWPEEDSEDRWLSQVEIVTHIGPARRLWMGPQFSFRTFQHMGQREDDLGDLDVTVTHRPQQSEPMQMPGNNPFHGHKPVFIECGSANSFELSPRFANMSIRGSREAVHLDVENELREAMSDTVQKQSGEVDAARKLKGMTKPQQEAEEEFFCLSTEDVRSTPAINEGRRTRNSSGMSQPRSRHTSTNSIRTVEMVTAETKIFSVAVQQGKSESTSMRNMVLKDVENQMIDRPVILSKHCTRYSEDQTGNSEDEFKPAQRDTEIPGSVESSNMVGELETALNEVQEIQETARVNVEASSENEPKKSKKKSKKNKNPESITCSSADETKEVEVKSKKKKNKNKEDIKEKSPEPVVFRPAIKEKSPEPVIEYNFEKEKTPKPLVRKTSKNLKTSESKEHDIADLEVKENKDDDILVVDLDDKFEEVNPSNRKYESFPQEDSNDIFEEFAKEKITYPEDFSPEKDLVEFSEEESSKIVEIDENDDSEKVDFFIREKSSSVDDDDDMQTSDVKVDPTSAKPNNPWFDDFLKKSSSMIEDQIFGAAKKYEDQDDKIDDDEEMVEMDKNQENVEKNIADLLEDEGDQSEKHSAEKLSSSLPQLLKLEPKKTVPMKETQNEPYSSDDDFMFRPVPNKRNKKKQKQKSVESEEDFRRCQGDSSAADSESEKFSELENMKSSKTKGKDSKDGWSFEIDEEDVNKLLEKENMREPNEKEERTALEDVFRFDSEMGDEESTTTNKNSNEGVGGKCVSVEDLNDALKDETDESEAEGILIVKKKESTDSENDVSTEFKECKPLPATSMSSSYAETTDASESSVTNSPNIRATKSKGKKGKKKKR